MQVAIDARLMQFAIPGGIGRSLNNLVPLLAKSVDVHLLTDNNEPPIDTDLPQTRLVQPVPGVHVSWLQLSAARWLRGFPGVFHCPYYGLPHYLPVPGVVTIHDITYEHHPQWFSRRQALSFRQQSRRAAKTAAVILTGSEFIRQDLVSTYGIDPERILVSPQGVDPAFSSDVDPGPVRARLGITRPYVVALGGAVRRNLPVAVEAWASAVQAGADVDLVVVGAEEPARERGVHWAGRVPDQEWAALLAGSVAFLYPTAYEGFGMPGLEALAAGAPVIGARVGSLPEVLGDAAEWAESLDAPDVTAALLRLVGDPARAAGLRLRGIERARVAPGWDVAAAVHLEAYRRAAA